jgi:hypothetical protein
LIGAAGEVKTRRMDVRANSSLADELAGALDWWRDAGIEYAFRDEPRQWLAAPAPVEEPAFTPFVAMASVLPEPASPLDDRGDWPTDLAAFTEWWLAEPWLDAGRTQNRIPPRGSAHGKLMVLVPQPEAEDRETLLSGPQGKLITGMLTAMGIAPAEAYVASVLPRYTPAADWNDIAARGLNEVLLHHVALAAPMRVIAFGDTILSLLGNDPTNSAAPPNHIAVGRGTIPLLPLRSLEGLLARPGWKADVWKKWLAWTR